MTDILEEEAVTQPRKPPPPLEWHPFYQGHMWLLDWLNGDPNYPSHAIIVALPERDPSSFLDRRIVLDKRKAHAPAPYVGDAFRYGWHFATDELGRAISGESFRVYSNGRTILPWEAK